VGARVRAGAEVEAESIEHSRLAPASAWKAKVGVASLVSPVGPESIATVGGVVSTVHSKEAGEASVLAALSIARTSNLWEPSAREE
jgi:hypothetical protein